MKFACCWAGIVGVLFVFQSALLPMLAFHGVSADLLLAFVVSFAFLRGSRLGVLCGFLCGLLQDLATGTFFGTNIFCKMIIGYVCGAFSNRVFKEQLFLPLLSVAMASVLNYFLLAVLMVLLGYRFDLLVHLQQVLVPMVLYNIVFAMPVHYLVYLTCERMKEKK